MRTLLPILAGLYLAMSGVLHAADDERATTIARQKKDAETAWTAMDVGNPAHLQTKHLLVYAPKSFDKRLKAIGAVLEKYHEVASTTLGLKDDAYPGKITVYLFAEKESLPAFIRRVEKRRPMGVSSGSFQAGDDRLHVVAIPGGGKGAIGVEYRAGEMIAGLLLQRKAGIRTQLPEWLLDGFPRTTSYRAAAGQKFVIDDRKQLRMLVKKRNASDAWGDSLEGDEAQLMQSSVAELVGYGLTMAQRNKVLDGFKPGENIATKTTAQALEAANITAGQINRAWKKFVK